jgi:hypothetical protein
MAGRAWGIGGVALLGLALGALPGVAAAGPALGADVEYDAGTGDALADRGGLGVAVRLGWKLGLGVIQLVPELAGTRNTFNPSDSASVAPRPDLNLYRGVVGLRVGLGGLLAPGAFAHVGYGRASYAGDGANPSGATGDLGVTLDLTALPVVDVGVHALYGLLEPGGGDPAFRWYGVGAHVEVSL